MTVYGPVTGVTKDQLFDTIINNIDASLSGNATGWSLVLDGRDTTRVPTADGVSAIKLPLDTAPTPTNITQANLAKNRVAPTNMFRNQATYYTIVTNRTSTITNGEPKSALLTSVDLVNWTIAANTFEHVSISGGNDQDAAYGYTPLPMDDGRNWLHTIRTNAAGVGSLVITYPTTYTNETSVSGSATVTNSNFPAGQDVQGAFGVSRALIYRKPTWYSYRHSGTKASFFAVNSDGSKLIRYTLEGADFADALNNFDTEVTPNPGQIMFTNTELAVDAILGVVDIYDVTDNSFRVVVNAISGADNVLFTYAISNPIHPVSYVDYTKSFVDSEISNEQTYMVNRQLNLGIQFDYTVGNIISTSPSFTMKSLGAAESVGDAIPDAKGLSYEYCVLESDNSGELVILAQLDPNQVSPPTVAGLTDTLPILARPVRGFDATTFRADKFFFDPINTSDQVAIAPAVFTIPDVLADPEETFRYWMKVNSRQIYFYCESTNGINQSLHINILDKVAPYNLTDNVLVSSAGVATGVGSVYLGRGGASESDTLNRRGDAKRYYPRAVETTYSTMLTTTNLVDNRNVSVDVFAVDNSSDFSTAPSAGLFLAGKLYDTKYSTNNAGLTSGDTEVINGDTYTYFETTSTADVNEPTTLNKLSIKWV